MGDFNKVFSFILGLVVVIVFLAVATNRLNLKNRISFLKGSKAVVSPTPTPYETIEIAGGDTLFPQKKNPTPTTSNLKNVKQTPKTGPEQGILLLSFLSGAFGFFLRKRA